jgi:hypothetical protein
MLLEDGFRKHKLNCATQALIALGMIEGAP